MDKKYSSLMDVIGSGYDDVDTLFSSDLFALDKKIESLLWYELISDDVLMEKPTFHFTEYEEEAEFERGSTITAYDLLSKLGCPYSSYMFDDINGYSNCDKPSILIERNRVKSWTVNVQMDRLKKYIDCREGVIYTVVIVDGEIKISRANVYKNLDWYEFLLSFLCSDDSGVEMFVLFLDEEFCEPVIKFYNYVTCGILVNTKDKKMTFYDRETAAVMFHTFSANSKSENWTSSLWPKTETS